MSVDLVELATRVRETSRFSRVTQSSIVSRVRIMSRIGQYNKCNQKIQFSVPIKLVRPLESLESSNRVS